MIRGVPARVWAFDLEWVPDMRAGRLLFDPTAQARDGHQRDGGRDRPTATETQQTPAQR